MTNTATVGWRGGSAAPIVLSFDVDAESAILAAGVEYASHAMAMTHQAFGPRVGVPRLLGLLAEYGLPATFFVPGLTADRYPEVVEAILIAGHEVGHHSYSHVSGIDLGPDGERRDFERALEALDRRGVRPRGHRAALWEATWQTPGLVAEYGLLYDSSLMDADYPYELEVGNGQTRSLVEIPIQWALDDWEQFCFLPEVSGSGLIETPAKARELWQAEFEGLRSVGGCWVLTNHPFLSGRPSRAHELDQLMAHVVSCSDDWVASLEDIARHVRGLGLDRRTVELPTGLEDSTEAP